jgi:hypothetical protein
MVIHREGLAMDFEVLLDEGELIALAKRKLTHGKFEFKGVWSGRRSTVIEITADEFDACSIEYLGKMMPYHPAPGVMYSQPPHYWRDVKDELHLFICTDDKKYADLRKSISTMGTKSQTTIVSTISAAMAIHIGLVAAAIVPFCALSLAVIARIGKNAWCRQRATYEIIDMPISEFKKKKNDKIKGDTD